MKIKDKYRVTNKNIMELVNNSENVQKIWASVHNKRPKAKANNELVLYDFVDSWMLDRVRNFLSQASGDVNIKINSWGGDVFAGFAIYNEFSDYDKGEVNMKIMGMAASAAALVFLAGDNRKMKKTSMLMFHKSWNFIAGNADELRKAAETLDKIDSMMIDMIESKLDIEGSVNDFLLKEEFLTAKEAEAINAAETESEDEKDEYEDPDKKAEEVDPDKEPGTPGDEEEPDKKAEEVDPDKEPGTPGDEEVDPTKEPGAPGDEKDPDKMAKAEEIQKAAKKLQQEEEKRKQDEIKARQKELEEKEKQAKINAEKERLDDLKKEEEAKKRIFVAREVSSMMGQSLFRPRF